MKAHKLLWQEGDQKGHLVIKCPQNPTKFHTHDFDELVFVISGSGIHVIGDEKYPLMQGDVFVIKADQVHKFEKCRQLFLVNREYRWIENYSHLEKDYSTLTALKTLFVHEPLYRKHKKFKAKLHLVPWQLDEIVFLLEIMKKEEKEKRPGYNSILENMFKTILIKVCRFFTETHLPGPKKMLKMGAVIDYINDHFHENIPRDKLVEVADMPRGSFCRTFKETTGLPPIDYLIRLRIEKAVKILTENHEIRIIDVALGTGFENSAYFSKKFKQIIGISPLAYQKSQRTIAG